MQNVKTPVTMPANLSLDTKYVIDIETLRFLTDSRESCYPTAPPGQ